MLENSDYMDQSNKIVHFTSDFLHHLWCTNNLLCSLSKPIAETVILLNLFRYSSKLWPNSGLLQAGCKWAKLYRKTKENL